MYVVAIHKISDPEGFVAASDPKTNPIPKGLTLHYVIPSVDGTRAVCLWEAKSQERVEELVEQVVGDFSSNEYFEVDSPGVW